MIGLIGKKLSHSYSKIIHEALQDYKYDLIEVNEEELEDLFINRRVKACNVTIPYKQDVIKYLDYRDDVVDKIGACNTVVLKDNQYYGYNTDVYGFKMTLDYNEVTVKDKKVIILGNGGAATAVEYVLRSEGCTNIIKVKKNISTETITYEKCYKEHLDADIIINTSPVGMYPNNDELVIDISRFKSCETVIDVIYNPLKTLLLTTSEDLGIKAISGLLMLVGQAVKAIEYFSGDIIQKEVVYEMLETLSNEKRNIVLIGMPSAGKSTIAKLLSERINKEVISIDEEIVKKTNKSIKEIFNESHESGFRKIETSITKDISKLTGKIIDCGGGIVCNKENMLALKQNGLIVYVDRDLSKLIVSDSRPLSTDKDQLIKLYNERKSLYEYYSDVTLVNDGKLEESLDKLISLLEIGE